MNTNRKEINLKAALFPIVILVGLLSYNVFVYKDSALDGSNQFILLISAAVAALLGGYYGNSYKDMLEGVADNVKSTTTAFLILLMVGALSGTWLISGIIPAMIYYGIQILNPTFFLVACVIIAALISVATGSSWTTSATVGIALVGIGGTLGVPLAMTAGAIISGAYFGDKMSPLSDTTNLAPAVAGGELFDHIKYMTYTTIPSISIALIFFFILGFGIDATGEADISTILLDIKKTFNVSPLLFLVPIVVVVFIVKKAPPLLALLVGTLLGGIFAILFQPEIIMQVAQTDKMSFQAAYQGVINAITIDTSISTSNAILNDLFNSGGMKGMLGTIWLILCAMVFGGIMDKIGALKVITTSLLNVAQTTFGLFASTVTSCLALNLTASDQYLAIVVPGKMFASAYKDKNLAPENLSRTLEDSGTVTSAIVPWNTCGAYHSSVLGVPVIDYMAFAVFNYVSPFVTLLFAALKIKIKTLKA